MTANDNGGEPTGSPNAAGDDRPSDLDDYLAGIKQGDRSVLSRAITLVESTLDADRRLARDLIDACLPFSGRSLRLGVSGLPGAGKSTLLDKLGVMLVAMGNRVAVLTIDPSSDRTGGSILGDKTRMAGLSREEHSFIRPSPAGGILGGVAGGTRASIILCEAAGYDVVIVETVGVGQSESVVANLVDFVLLLLVTGAGDELQGMKRGVIEHAHAIAITKADGANAAAAAEMQALYRELIRHMQPTDDGWRPRVLATSAVENKGITELWSIVSEFRQVMKQSGAWDRRRQDQSVRWMHAAVDDGIKSALMRRTGVKERIEELEEEVRAGKTSPLSAARQILDRITV